MQAPKTAQTLVHIHASAEELNRLYQADLAIQANLPEAELQAALERPQGTQAAIARAALKR